MNKRNFFHACFISATVGGGGKGGLSGGGGVLDIRSWLLSNDHTVVPIRPSHLYTAETTHVGFSTTRQTFIIVGTKREAPRDVRHVA